MHLLGREIRWDNSSLEERSLAQITDIDIAFSEAINRATGVEDSGLPSVYRAESLISGMVASLPLEQVMGKVATDELPSILARPNPVEEYVDTMSQIVSSLIFRGNAYLLPRTRNEVGNILSCIVAQPDEVTVQWDARNVYREYHWRGRLMRPDQDIIHVRLNSWPNRPEGVGPITACRLFLEGEKFKMGAAATLFDDGLMPSYMIKVPGPLTDTEAEEKKAKWVEARKKSRIALTQGDVTLEQMTLAPVDAQFIEFMGWGSKEIATLFGLDGFLLNTDSGGTSLTYSCLTPEAPVLTEGLEYVPVGQLEVGDRLIAFDEESPLLGQRGKRRQFRTAVVTNNTRKVAPTYRVELDDGTVTFTTPNHMWLVNDSHKTKGWRTTEDLAQRMERGAKGTEALRVFPIWETDMSWDAGFLAGMFDGEGHISFSRKGRGRQIIRMAQKHNEAWDQVHLSLKKLEFPFGVYDYPQRSDVAHLDIRGGVAELMRFMGQVRPPRLLARWWGFGGADSLGELRTLEKVGFKSITRSLDREIVELETTTGTLIVQGFAHHNTTESALRHFTTLTLNPVYLERVAAGFTRMLPSGRSARFVTTELFRADQKSRYEGHKIALDAGFKTINEVRADEGLPALVGGDELSEAPVQEEAFA